MGLSTEFMKKVGRYTDSERERASERAKKFLTVEEAERAAEREQRGSPAEKAERTAETKKRARDKERAAKIEKREFGSQKEEEAHHDALRAHAKPILKALEELRQLSNDSQDRFTDFRVRIFKNQLIISATFYSREERENRKLSMREPAIQFKIDSTAEIAGSYLTKDQTPTDGPRRGRPVEHLLASIDDMLEGLAQWAGRQLINHPAVQAENTQDRKSSRPRPNTP